MISDQLWHAFLRYLIDRHGKIRGVISEEMEEALAEYLARRIKKKSVDV